MRMPASTKRRRSPATSCGAVRAGLKLRLGLDRWVLGCGADRGEAQAKLQWCNA